MTDGLSADPTLFIDSPTGFIRYQTGPPPHDRSAGRAEPERSDGARPRVG
jgi:hypothetical protein